MVNTPLTLLVGVSLVTIQSGPVTSFLEALSTSIMPEYNSMSQDNGIRSLLKTLAPEQVRVQIGGRYVPQISADTWSFETLPGGTSNSGIDPTIQLALQNGKQGPLVQLGEAPAFLYPAPNNPDDPNDTPSTNFQLSEWTTDTFEKFVTSYAEYAQNMVRYYNKGGFTSGGVHYVSASSAHIQWWGIYNEPDAVHMSPEQYVYLYNTVVSAMLAIDPTLKLEALDLSSCPQSVVVNYVSYFSSHVVSQVNAVALHLYGALEDTGDASSAIYPTVTDSYMMNNISNFISTIHNVRSLLDLSQTLSGTPILITENNINPLGDGTNTERGYYYSGTDSSEYYVDPRGSSAFFAAWRPYEFSQFAKSGISSLYHLYFIANEQFGEVDGNANDQDNGGEPSLNNPQVMQPMLSYWVDYFIAHYFPPSTGATILATSTSDSSDIESLAVKYSDGSVVVMIVNHGVASDSDINGTGAFVPLDVDVSSLGSFTSASELVIDADTNLTQGPVAFSLSVQSMIPIKFNGYGVTFIQLKP